MEKYCSKQNYTALMVKYNENKKDRNGRIVKKIISQALCIKAQTTNAKFDLITNINEKLVILRF